jgi:hypothetical protein
MKCKFILYSFIQVRTSSMMCIHSWLKKKLFPCFYVMYAPFLETQINLFVCIRKYDFSFDSIEVLIYTSEVLYWWAIILGLAVQNLEFL